MSAVVQPVKLGDVVLGRYRVVEQIGSGGHSVVFLGHDERLSRPVCVKVFSGFGSTGGVSRTSYEHFVQEAFALSRLTHPNTLRIFDFGYVGETTDEHGSPVQICEYMNAGTLSQRVREQGVQSVDETIRVMTAMCGALSEAHAVGIVHRDIKPQNILFGAVGGTTVPKLADFGIAKWSAEPEDYGKRADDTAVVAGQRLAMYSPSWAAPEQLAGQSVSPATDIYSLAVVAVYMLSSQAVFADEDVYAGYKRRRDGGAEARAALSHLSVPSALVDALARALAFEPGERYRSIEELAAELQYASMLETSPFGRSDPDTIAPREASPFDPPGRDSFTLDIPPIASSPRPDPISGPAEPKAPRSSAPDPALPLDRSSAGSGEAGRVAEPESSPRLSVIDSPQRLGDRAVQFVLLRSDDVHADLEGPAHSRLRVTAMHTPRGRLFHLKGMTCFVSRAGGRPSPAVQIEGAAEVILVTPRAQEIGHLRVVTGVREGSSHVFSVGEETCAVRVEDCEDPVLFDFGPKMAAYFVYTRGRPPARTRGR